MFIRIRKTKKQTKSRHFRETFKDTNSQSLYARKQPGNSETGDVGSGDLCIHAAGQ